MSDKLQKLRETARGITTTPEAREAQRVSFAYGNTMFENQEITREDVARASQALRESRVEPTNPPESPKPSDH